MSSPYAPDVVECKTKRSLVEHAWLECKVSADLAGGIPEVVRGTARAPGWFVEEELGFALTEGPSLLQRSHMMTEAPRRAGKVSRREAQQVLRQRLRRDAA